MRTTVIPAQITTVEDKIAGNLNLTQIVILMVPVFWTAVVYAIFLPVMRLSLYKLPVILVVLVVCLILSLRIKGKVVVEWLAVLLRYHFRPKYFLFDKNDPYLRTLDLPVFEKKPMHIPRYKVVKKEIKNTVSIFNLGDTIKFDNLLGNPGYSVRYKSGKKGGINVAFEKIQK